MSTRKIITGLVASFAAGAVIGMLFAPDEGTNTRKKIKDKGRGFKDGITSKFNSIIDEVANEYGSARERSKQLWSSGKDNSSSAREEARHVL